MSDVNRSTPGGRARRRPLPPSPCVGICLLDETHGFCSGCGRSPHDIEVWGNASDAEKSAIWRALPGRLAVLGAKSFRLPPTPERISDFITRSLAERAGCWVVGLPGADLCFDAGRDVRWRKHGGCVTAENADGYRLRLCDNERMRAFGLAGGDGSVSMPSIALALPRGRAELDDDDALVSGHGVVLRDGLFVRLRLIASSPETALALAAIVARRPAEWSDSDMQLIETVTFVAETALGDIAVSASRDRLAAIAALGPIGDQHTVPALPVAFAACARFDAADPDWLADAMAP